MHSYRVRTATRSICSLKFRQLGGNLKSPRDDLSKLQLFYQLLSTTQSLRGCITTDYLSTFIILRMANIRVALSVASRCPCERALFLWSHYSYSISMIDIISCAFDERGVITQEADSSLHLPSILQSYFLQENGIKINVQIYKCCSLTRYQIEFSMAAQSCPVSVCSRISVVLDSKR